MGLRECWPKMEYVYEQSVNPLFERLEKICLERTFGKSGDVTVVIPGEPSEFLDREPETNDRLLRISVDARDSEIMWDIRIGEYGFAVQEGQKYVYGNVDDAPAWVLLSSYNNPEELADKVRESAIEIYNAINN